MPQFQGSVASGQSLAARLGLGSNPNVRQGGFGELAVSSLLPRLSEATKSKATMIARAALQATSLVGTAMVGLQLWNSSANVELHITKLGGNIVATSATQTGVVLSAGTGQIVAPTSTTAATRQQNNYIGQAVGVGIAYNAGTFTNAPVAFMDLLHNTAAIATTGEDAGYYIPLEGSIIVPPQCYLAFAAVGGAGAAASNNHWIEWVEVGV